MTVENDFVRKHSNFFVWGETVVWAERQRVGQATKKSSRIYFHLCSTSRQWKGTHWIIAPLSLGQDYASATAVHSMCPQTALILSPISFQVSGIDYRMTSGQPTSSCLLGDALVLYKNLYIPAQASFYTMYAVCKILLS